VATIYIDPTSATNGAGTIGDPKNTCVGLSWVAGNEYLQKAGTTFTTAVGSGGRIAPGVSGTAGARILIGMYGEGAKPKIINLADTGFNLDRRAYITLENFQIDNTGATTAAIGGGGDTSTEAVDNIVRFCEVYGGTVEAMSFVTNANRQTLRNLRVYGNYIHDVGGHGIICAGLHLNTQIFKNRVIRTGSSSAKHGISAHPHRTTSTPSWSNVSGNIYKTTIGPQTNITTVLDIYAVRYVTGNITLTRAGTAASPGLNEYGFTGGELYINIGGVPSGQIVFSYSEMVVDFSDNIVEDIVDFDGNEGHGIQLDDLVRDSFIRRNKISGCDGRGIAVNMGRSNQISDNLVYNCVNDGIRVDVNAGTLNNVYGNTVVAGPRTTSTTAIVLGVGNTAKNNVATGYAVGVSGTAASTEQYNCLYATTPRSGGISAGTGSVSVDPQLSASYRPTVSSPLLGAGVHLGYRRDIEKKQRPNPPAIGAFDAATMISG